VERLTEAIAHPYPDLRGGLTMRWWSELKYVARKLNRRRAERELKEEIGTHLEMETQEKINNGLSREEARYAAQRAFGSVSLATEDSRAWWGGRMLEEFLQDLRCGARMLVKEPSFTLVVVITLALGIGANTAIFSVVNTVLIRSLPYAQAERLVTVWEKTRTNEHNQINIGNFLDWQAQNSVFTDMAAFADARAILTGVGEPEEIPAQLATDNLFTVLGVNMLLGRAFTHEDSRQGQNNVIVISYGLWRRRFAGDPNVIGRKVLLGNSENTIVGVTPPSFKWHIRKNSLTGAAAEIWTPLIVNDFMRSRQGRFASAVARLKPGVTLAQARAQMDTIGLRLAEQYKDFNNGCSVNVVPLRQQLAGEIRQGLLVLMGAVSCVLLIACANVANLLLARAATRHKEIAVRMALGAGRRRILRQLLTESLLLASLGGAAGLLLAGWCADLLVRLSPSGLADLQGVEISAPVLSFTFALTLLTGIIFGLAPAFESSRLNLSETLKEGGRSLAGARRSQRLRGVFVISETALALVLLVGAGLLFRSFLRLQSVDTGFNARNVLTMRVSLPGRVYNQDGKIVNFFNRAVEGMQALPGVESAGAVNFLPFAGPGAATGFQIEGRSAPPPDQMMITGVSVADRNFFRTLQIPLKRGRLFTETEIHEMSHVVVINEALARKYFANEEPIGKRIAIGLRNGGVPSEIIGIIGDVKQAGFDRAAEPMAYWPIPKSTYRSMTFVIRAKKGDANALAPAARDVIRSLDAQQPVADVRLLESFLESSVGQQRFNTLLLMVFAAVALLLAGVGLYGVMAWMVSRRTREIGVRMALGARGADVMKLILKQAMLLVGIGAAAGLSIALLATRMVESLLYGVSRNDPLTFVVVSLILAGVAFLACYVPARRATKVDPMVALRFD
jgi:putative ABC transport system permease protein